MHKVFVDGVLYTPCYEPACGQGERAPAPDGNVPYHGMRGSQAAEAPTPSVFEGIPVRENVALFDGELRERLAGLLLAPFKAFLVRGLVERGVPEDVARRRLAAIGDGTLLKLIFENWDKILQMILLLFGGF